MWVAQRKAWCILGEKQGEQAVAPYKLATPATWQVQCPQNEGCKEFENLNLPMKDPQTWSTTTTKAAFKTGFRCWCPALTATFKTMLNVKCVCGHCEGVREVLEAQWQMTNCNSTCPRTFRCETTELFDAVYKLLLKLAFSNQVKGGKCSAMCRDWGNWGMITIPITLARTPV